MTRAFFDKAREASPAKRLLLLLALLAISRLLVTVVIWRISGPSGFVAPDSGTYTQTADSLVHGSFTRDGMPDIFRTPGYPFVLVAGAVLGHPILVGLIENLLFALGSACLIWRIVQDVLPNSLAADWAVLLYCIEPLGFLFADHVLSETFFCTLFLAFLWLLLRFFRTPSYSKLMLAVLALAAAAYTRPVALYLGIWLTPVFLFFPQTISARQRLRRAVLFPAAFLLLVAPWIARNIAVAGYAGFSTNADASLYFWSAAAVTARVENRSFAQVQEDWGGVNQERYFHAHPEQRGWSQAQKARFWHVEAKRIILQHPMVYAFLHAKGCLIVLFDPEATDMLKTVRLYPKGGLLLLSRTVDEGPFRAVLWLARNYPVAFATFLLLEAVLLLYYLLGIAGLRRLPAYVRFVLLYLAAYFVLVSGAAAAVGRYRVPIMPLICIAGAAAIAHWKPESQPEL